MGPEHGSGTKKPPEGVCLCVWACVSAAVVMDKGAPGFPVPSPICLFDCLLSPCTWLNVLCPWRPDFLAACTLQELGSERRRGRRPCGAQRVAAGGCAVSGAGAAGEPARARGARPAGVYGPCCMLRRPLQRHVLCFAVLHLVPCAASRFDVRYTAVVRPCSAFFLFVHVLALFTPHPTTPQRVP